MSSTPKELLERFSQSTTVSPGLSERAIEQFQQELQTPIPDEIRQLLLYSAAFESKPFGTVRFTGHEGFELAEVFPRSVPLLPDRKKGLTHGAARTGRARVKKLRVTFSDTAIADTLEQSDWSSSVEIPRSLSA